MFIMLMAIFALVVFYKISSDTKKGLNFLASQEHRNLRHTEEQINFIKDKEKKEAIKEGKLDAYAMLGDFVFYGDSRVLHYYSYGFLDSSRILADNGETYADVQKYRNELESLSPENVFIAYGVNDIYYKVGEDVEGGHPAVVKEALEHIHEVVPDATIYICGMIPISPYGLEYLHLSENSGEYNATLKEISEQYEYVEYIDDENLSIGGLADIYAPDGYHFKSEFYQIWTQYIASHLK